ncbi:Na+/H+ antiporter family protein [Marinomonas spartinae]|uniref:Na+/H+ antiporter family protein n=1 Tax=Marinomonas spartinae TaxID=1792290 RepID=A0A1A8TR08_9GAMM|nr:Na+/H+ antiporter family protein [Marinomonas spartinae]SBS32788.1 Na+/H+ antiporter family protein [Marinomonas spartinae]SBS35622.1 Na+/H+ antiporter family protein [Marinomonas spartinae]
MNAVVVGVALMLILSVARLNVVISLCVSAIVAGLVGGMSLLKITHVFEQGLGDGAVIALSYVMLGAFAVAISASGITDWLANKIISLLGRSPSPQHMALMKTLVCSVLLVMAVCSQNLIPVHIAFIPILVPPLLHVMTYLKLDRRLIACVLTFGLVTPYMVLPVGFGGVFLHQLLASNLAANGLEVDPATIAPAMWLPATGMVMGLLIAVFISYRKPRDYSQMEEVDVRILTQPSCSAIFVSIIAILMALVTQLYTGSMIFGALSGLAVYFISGQIRWKQSQSVLSGGVELMAMIGFIMISAAGFAAVIRATGEVNSLVNVLSGWLGSDQAIASASMLLVGLIITMGIGSSFSTIPIIATIYVPLALHLGFSHLAIVALVGTAAALGDAGSPASDSTLGPTSGLNADGQHDHIRDSVIPTFLHYNLPLLVMGWVATLVL